MIGPVIDRVRKSEFLKNTAVLTSGTTIAQALAIFTAPLLTRIYQPSDYGLLGMFMAFTALFVTCSTFQYHNAIVVAKDDEEGRTIMSLAIFICIVISSALAIVVVLFRNPISRFYHNPELANWLLLAPVSILFSGMNNIFSAWAIRLRKFKMLSVNRILASLLTPLISISIGLLIKGLLGLMAGLILSQFITAVRLIYSSMRRLDLKLYFNKAELQSVFLKFKYFPLFSVPSDFLNNFTNQIPVLMLSKIGGSSLVGFYGLSVRLLGLPSSLISASIGEVFSQRASKDYQENGTCRPIFLKVLKTLFFFAIPPFTVMFFLGPQIFGWVFGEVWKEAGYITQIIAVLYFFKFIVSPLTYITIIAQKQWIGFIVDILLFIVMSIIYFIAVKLNLSYNLALLFYSLSYSALYFLTFYISFKLTKNVEFISKNQITPRSAEI